MHCNLCHQKAHSPECQGCGLFVCYDCIAHHVEHCDHHVLIQIAEHEKGKGNLGEYNRIMKYVAERVEKHQSKRKQYIPFYEEVAHLGITEEEYYRQYVDALVDMCAKIDEESIRTIKDMIGD